MTVENLCFFKFQANKQNFLHEDLIDDHSYTQNLILSSCKIKAWKKFRPEQDSKLSWYSTALWLVSQKVMVSNPIQAWTLFRCLFQNWLIQSSFTGCVYNCSHYLPIMSSSLSLQFSCMIFHIFMWKLFCPIVLFWISFINGIIFWSVVLLC